MNEIEATQVYDHEIDSIDEKEKKGDFKSYKEYHEAIKQAGINYEKNIS